ncbi:UNVERIFIED_CONTAM: hypothetical protein Sangu_2666700 [Sesamum angustifolium]|uniref:Uncharacterized protein n=1 Tax=Sesamum angustifolium TaxID=2727405 RepID=A0AAW2J1J8_9LAMI
MELFALMRGVEWCRWQSGGSSGWRRKSRKKMAAILGRKIEVEAASDGASERGSRYARHGCVDRRTRETVGWRRRRG